MDFKKLNQKNYFRKVDQKLFDEKIDLMTGKSFLNIVQSAMIFSKSPSGERTSEPKRTFFDKIKQPFKKSQTFNKSSNELGDWKFAIHKGRLARIRHRVKTCF